MRCFSGILAAILTTSVCTAQMPSPWPAHDTSRPHPEIVQPGSQAGEAPSDATILFDGSDLSNWRAPDGGESKWELGDGAMMPTPSSGPTVSKAVFGDVQLHAEWSSPTPPKGKSQGRGNSGIYFMGKYEVQVLDSYENETYADGQAAAIYGQNPPMVNASRAPGEWQTYDIIFRRPRWDEDGNLTHRARMTVIHNGVVVQDAFELFGPTNWLKHDTYAPHADKGPIQLQDHGNPVRFRNIWVRELPDPPAYDALYEAESKMEVDADALQMYVGKYDNYEIQLHDGILQLLFWERPFDLIPQSEHRFAFRHTNASVEFDVDGNEVKSITVELMGGKTTKAKE